MSFDPLKWLARLIPVDPDDSGGFWIFRLPERAQWMNDVFKYHDYYYRIGPASGMKLSEVDVRIWKGLSIRAELEPDLIKRCHMYHDICKYWPIMRSAGHYLYNRHAQTE